MSYKQRPNSIRKFNTKTGCAGRYDLIVDLQRSDRVRGLLIALRLIGAAPRHVIGNRGGFPYTVQPAIRDKKAPALPMMRSMLEAAGIAYATTRPVLHASAEHRAHVARLKAEHGLEDGRYAVLLPGSQAAGWLKRWGVVNYRALARRLLDAPDGFTRVAVVGGPDEVDDCAAIAADNPGVVNLNGALKLLEIAPLCEGAACVAANDTGTAHIAAAADRPMLVICGPTNPARVKPIGERVRAIQARLPCRDCYAKDCANPERLACMARLTPEFVAAELRDVMHGGGNAVAAGVEIIRV